VERVLAIGMPVSAWGPNLKILFLAKALNIPVWLTDK